MPDARQSKHASFKEARSAFEKLETQDKVAFVVEATFATLGDALQVAGRQLGSVLEDLTRQAADAFGGEEEPGSPPGTPPAAPKPPVDPAGPEVGSPRGEAPGGPSMPPPTPD